MFKNKKIIAVTPAGRKPSLELLIPQIYKLKDIVDEYHLWVNTDNTDDINYMQEQEKKYNGFIKLITGNFKKCGFSICRFFDSCIDDNTVYVRFDDDIIWLDEIEQFEKFLQFRIDNPEYFLVYANILNNAVITHLHQRFGNFNRENKVGYKCLDPTGWGDGNFAINLHNEIIKNNNLAKYRFNKPWILFDYERVSINVISWLGSEFKKFNGIVGKYEEDWLSMIKPAHIKMPNVIFGEYVTVHYGFCTQREILNQSDILDKYKALLMEIPDRNVCS